MRIALLLGLTLALPGPGLGSATPNPWTIVERVPHLPDGWALHSVPHPNASLVLSIALRHSGFDTLKTKLAGISDPESPSYGRHLSKDQIQDFRAPPRQTSDAVFSWLESKGITDALQAHDWIHFTATAQQTALLLQADPAYYSFEGERPVLRAREYSVPLHLRDAVDFIHPLANFMARRAPSRDRRRAILHVEPLDLPEESYRAQTEDPSRPSQAPDVTLSPANPAEPVRFNPVQAGEPTAPSAATVEPQTTWSADVPVNTTPSNPAASGCSGGVNPDCLKDLYNLHYDGGNESSITYGVAAFLEEYIWHPDTNDFMAVHAPYIPQDRWIVPVESINGGEDPQTMRDAGLEASLDVQYAVSLAYPANVVFLSTGGRGVKLDANGEPIERGDNEPFLEFIEHLLDKADDEIPHVIAISYADDEQSVPKPYALKVCDMFAALTARGVSVITATGDGGSRGVRYGNCLTNDGQKRPTTMGSFPAGCPYVTSVGATANVGPPFTATLYSTGGFSNYFPRPQWQDEAVQTYIAKMDGKLAGFYNSSGRAIPDIAAVGSGFELRWGGGDSSAQGTSASAPVIASMVALINDARVKAGKSVVGWLNPTLYRDDVRAVMADVASGSSASCVWEDGTVPGGWPALEGYDCVTGIGVPSDFQKFLKVFMDLP